MAAVAVIAGLALMAVLHELGHAAVARLLRLQVTLVSFGLGPPLFRRRLGATQVWIAPIPLGGFVRVAGLGDEPGPRPSHAAQLAVTLGGAAANYVVAAALGVALSLGWGNETGRVVGLEVTAVSAHAASQGLRVADVVTTADDAAIASVEELRARLRAASPRPVRLELLRDGATVAVEVSPEDPTRPGLGARYVPRPELQRRSPAAAVGSGLVEPLRTSAGLLARAGRMVMPGSGQRPVSAVGLAVRVEKSGRWDARRVLSFAALLSVIVGLFNLLPIPGLDGGRACLIVGESLSRRPLQGRVATVVQIAGALVLLAVWLVLIALDLLGG
ncbi:MAG TPA: M50 family metallopeptidase [Polyangiaceae bacterium]|nr:M50 family metallopeptidase [Polyangiaceae bacterium]